MNSNEKASKAKLVLFPQPLQAPRPISQEKTKKAMQRVGIARGKHLNTEHAFEIRDMLKRVTEWGGW